MTVNDIMTENPFLVQADTSLKNIIKYIENNPFDHIPVVNNASELMGLISKVDVYKTLLRLSTHTSGKVYTDNQLNHTTAQDIMTTEVVTLSVDDALDKAITVFNTHSFHSLPVLDKKILIGILTPKDILKHLSSDGSIK